MSDGGRELSQCFAYFMKLDDDEAKVKQVLHVNTLVKAAL